MGFLCASTIREYPLHLQYSTLPAAMTKHLLEIVKNLKVIKEFLFFMGRAQVPPHVNRSLLCARRSYFKEYFFNKLYV